MKQYQPHRSILKIIIYISIFPCLLFFLLLLMPLPSYKDGFRTLEEIDAYAKTIPENFKIDTDNTIKPDFSNYYNTLRPTWKSNLKDKIFWLLTLIKLVKPPVWSVSFFKEQLLSTAKQREAREFIGDFVCKLLPTAQSKIIIFGNVQGAFHSLTRCLQKIRELGIISDNLKITSPDNLIIFTGDVINRSPYTMETLSLVIKLIYLNPDNIIYLRGNHESGNYWQEHTLKTELQIRAANLSHGIIIPLVDDVNRFFNTLPLACYISMLSDAGNEFIRISDSGRGQNELLNEHSYSKFLTSKVLQRISSFNLKDKTDQAAGDIDIDIKVIFKGEKKREVYQPHEGLRLLAPDLDSTAWTILSCPTPVYQKAIKFMHDAFALLAPAKNIDEWKITLYNRNVQTQESFKATAFYLLSGLEENASTQEKKEAKTLSQEAKVQETKIPEPKTTNVSEASPSPAPIKAPLMLPASTETFDATSTSTIAEHAQAISKYTQAIAEHAQAIATTLKAQPQKTIETQPQNLVNTQLKKPVENPVKNTPVTTSQSNSVEREEELSAFEPITPQKDDVKKAPENLELK